MNASVTEEIPSFFNVPNLSPLVVYRSVISWLLSWSLDECIGVRRYLEVAILVRPRF